jgi:hypothetical protein
MMNEDEVTLLVEPHPWKNLEQKSQRHSWSLELVIALSFSLLDSP